MIVVSNTGPLIALAKVESLTLLRQLYGNLVVPTAVYAEMMILGASQPGAREVSDGSWIERVDVLDQVAVSLLRDRLDAGESEAIVLALERQADLLLIDEAKGRRVAQSKGITHVGTVGILVQAKRRALIATVTPLLDQLAVAGFRMDNALRQEVQRLAGELEGER